MREVNTGVRLATPLMRVEAASVDAVRERLQAAKQRQEGAAHAARGAAVMHPVAHGRLLGCVIRA